MELTPKQLSDLRWLAANPGITLIQFCNAKNVIPRDAAKRLSFFVLSGLLDVGEGRDMTYTVSQNAKKLYLERG